MPKPTLAELLQAPAGSDVLISLYQKYGVPIAGFDSTARLGARGITSAPSNFEEAKARYAAPALFESLAGTPSAITDHIRGAFSQEVPKEDPDYVPEDSYDAAKVKYRRWVQSLKPGMVKGPAKLGELTSELFDLFVAEPWRSAKRSAVAQEGPRVTDDAGEYASGASMHPLDPLAAVGLAPMMSVAARAAGVKTAPAESIMAHANREEAAPVGALAAAGKEAQTQFRARLSTTRNAISKLDPSLKLSWRRDANPLRFAVPSPFEYAPEAPLFGIRAGREVTVDIERLKTRQPTVAGYAVEDIAVRGDDPNVLPPVAQNEGLPSVAQLSDGSYVILSGNHRLAAAAIKGDTQARVNVVNANPDEAAPVVGVAGAGKVPARRVAEGEIIESDARIIERAQKSPYWPADWFDEPPVKTLTGRDYGRPAGPPTQKELLDAARWVEYVQADKAWDAVRFPDGVRKMGDERVAADARAFEADPQSWYRMRAAKIAFLEGRKGRPLTEGELTWEDLDRPPGVPEATGREILDTYGRENFMVLGHPELSAKGVNKPSVPPKLLKSNPDEAKDKKK